MQHQHLQENQEEARTTRAKATVGAEALVARVGYDESIQVDHWSQFMDSFVREHLTFEHQRLKALDQCLKRITKQLFGYYTTLESRLYRPEATTLVRLATALLAKRHEFLNEYVYSKEYQTQQNVHKQKTARPCVHSGQSS